MTWHLLTETTPGTWAPHLTARGRPATAPDLPTARRLIGSARARHPTRNFRLETRPDPPPKK